MTAGLDNWELIYRLALGVAFGGAIGFERQIHGRPAGFRTHILVCLASVLLMEVSEYYHHLSSFDPSYVRVDPGRIAAGAITGIGFLGAGVIIKLGPNVQGLTTAASLWMAAAIGMAIGAGMYAESAAAFVFTFMSLLTLRSVERLTSSTVYKTLTIRAGGEFSEDGLKSVLAKYRASIQRADYERDQPGGETTYTYTVLLHGKRRGDDIAKPLFDEISSLKHIIRSSLKV